MILHEHMIDFISLQAYESKAYCRTRQPAATVQLKERLQTFF